MSLLDRKKKETGRHVENVIPKTIIKILRGEIFLQHFSALFIAH